MMCYWERTRTTAALDGRDIEMHDSTGKSAYVRGAHPRAVIWSGLGTGTHPSAPLSGVLEMGRSSSAQSRPTNGR